jgi:glycosyltransferase involved in cell wall biosynthesis
MGVGNAPVVRCLEFAGRRVVFNVDGADWSRLKWGGFASRYLRSCELLAAHGRSPIVADAESVRRHYNSSYGRATVLIPYGAEPPADTGIETLKNLGLKTDGYILFVGRLVPENGAHDFLAAAGAALPGVPAVVVGDADYAAGYIAALRRDAPPSAVFTGYQFGHAYQQLTANAGLFVLAASVGGTHPVLLEQMAAGNCVLVRRTDSNLEVVGDTAITWSDPGELAEGLTRAWNDPVLRRELGEAARRRVAELYSWDTVTTAYIDLCRKTVDPSRVEDP